MTALAKGAAVKLGGVCVASIGFGGTESVFYSLTSCYGERATKGYAMGSGISFIVAPLLHSGTEYIV